MVSASFALADTNVHSLYDLIESGVVESPNAFPMINGRLAVDFTELQFRADGANGGTIGISVGTSDVDITGKEYAVLLASTSTPFVLRRAWGGARISAKEVFITASAATQVLHLLAAF